MNEILQGWETVVRSLAALVGAALAGWIVHGLLFGLGTRGARRTETVLDDLILRHTRGPSRVILPALSVSLFLPLLTLTPRILTFVERALSLILILAVAWVLVRLANVVEDFIAHRYEIDARDNLKARRIRTQTQILKKVVVVVVGILTLATLLMTFERGRQLGASILASAGIAGLIVGFAAQRSIATLVAGLQIAITQPIRIDDVVIVENEYGRIEEITLTYVVVRLWDVRRLILPITYFIEKPFQNWTRTSADLLATVFVYADYTVPVQAVRDALRRIVEASERWDGRACGLQVTNTTERTVELRALVSAGDSASAWELRCEVREKLIAFLQEQYPECLPKVRTQVEDLDHRTGKMQPGGSHAAP